MKTSHFLAALVFAGLPAGPVACRTGTPTSESTGAYIDNAAISATRVGTTAAGVQGVKELSATTSSLSS